MRIAVLTSLYPSPPRPFEGIFAERRWRGMVARGHAVRVTQPLPFTPGPLARGAWAEIRSMPESETRHGIEVERPRYLHLFRSARRNARRFSRVGTRRVLARERPDVVVCDYAWPAAEAAPLLARAGVPCVVSGRGSDVLQVAGEAGLGAELARCLRAACGWCAVSRDLLAVMDELAGAPGVGALVPNGVDLDAFPLGDTGLDRSDARRRLGLPATGALVLVVGHLIERKDPLLALDVAARSGDELSFAFLGRGPLLEACRRRAAESGLSDRVRFPGEVLPEALSSWYRAADLLLLTSRREGRPNVVLEALASGRPVLATESGGTGELLGPWRERSLARTRDPEELSRMLRALLADPPAPASLRASVEPLSWGASLEALERCLERATTRDPSSR